MQAERLQDLLCLQQEHVLVLEEVPRQAFARFPLGTVDGSPGWPSSFFGWHEQPSSDPEAHAGEHLGHTRPAVAVQWIRGP